MQTAIVIIIVAAALLFMTRRMWRQWHGGNACGCGNDECTCGKNGSRNRHPNEAPQAGSQAGDKVITGCHDCPLQGKCNYCQ